jgi:hypothetical protein
VLWLVLVAALPVNALDDAQRAYIDRDFRKARELFHSAAETDPDPERRVRALARAANIEWRIFHDLGAARKTLANSNEAPALIERARAEADLAHDYAAARSFAAKALAAAEKRQQKRQAVMVDSEAALTPVREGRLAGRCVPADSLAVVEKAIQQVIDRDGPLIGPDRILLQCAILLKDRPAMLRAWRWYYGSLRDVVPEDRRGLGEALANAKFFDEAALVLDDPCAPARIADPASREIVSYAAALRRIRTITNEHYRQLSLGNDDTKQFREDVERLRQPAAEKRFRAVVRKGQTGGVEDMHYGHAVLDATYDIEQYGNKAQLHFIALDGLVSSGYMNWQTDGGGGSGGWNSSEGIYQLRPMYADGPVGDWLVVSDREVRATRNKEAADESKRDETRDPSSAPLGTKLRMELESNDHLLAELRKKGLEGDALRVAFIDRVRQDVFASSILAHEGRHAIDASRFVIRGSATLEFRAKLSEVAFAPDPRRAVTTGIFVQLDAASAHGQANRQVYEGLTKWMREHAGQIAGLDSSKPLLPQFDKLTDDQMRQAFRSMDPIAK